MLEFLQSSAFCKRSVQQNGVFHQHDIHAPCQEEKYVKGVKGNRKEAATRGGARCGEKETGGVECASKATQTNSSSTTTNNTR